MKTKNLLVTLADRNYIDAAKQVFSSAYFYGNWTGEMMLLAYNSKNNKFSEEEMNEFKKNGILVRECSSISKSFDIDWPELVFSKYEIFKEEFKRWNKIVFMDADVIVTHPIIELVDKMGLWAVEASSRYLWKQFREESGDNKEIWQKLRTSYNLRERAFNSGVIAFSTDIIDKNTHRRLTYLTERYNSILMHDESILNLLFYREWNKLPSIYNAHCDRQGPWRETDKDRTNIVHFLGKNKPWHGDNPLNRLWKENLDRFHMMREKRPLEINRFGNLRTKYYSCIENINRIIDYKKFHEGKDLKRIKKWLRMS